VVALCLGAFDGPRGVGVSYERSTPVRVVLGEDGVPSLGLGFRGEGPEFRVKDLGCRVKGVGCRV
jgi:hypothetical protein